MLMYSPLHLPPLPYATPAASVCGRLTRPSTVPAGRPLPKALAVRAAPTPGLAGGH